MILLEFGYDIGDGWVFVESQFDLHFAVKYQVKAPAEIRSDVDFVLFHWFCYMKKWKKLFNIKAKSLIKEMLTYAAIPIYKN